MAEISQNSRRIARNTVLLYFRMLLMMFIGLFTSRVVLKSLGVIDFGIYNAVGGVVTVFTFLTAAIAQAISRFMAFELGKGESEKLHKVFCTSIIIQLVAAVVVAVLVESAGMWLLARKMVIPEGRMEVARLVMHCSLGVLAINLLSVPYNAMIMAHEKMDAYAYISILEAVLKLSVAALLFLGKGDKLKLYAFLMLAAALIIRLTYGVFCKRHFAESRGRFQGDRECLKEISGFVGWSFLGSGVSVLNTQGLSILSNMFFGVLVNTARGLAIQVEGIVKQFVTNILQAFNPQITKSWSRGDSGYCFELTFKASRYCALILMALVIPIFFEAEILMHAWLGQLPQYAALFARLTLVCLMVDMIFNPLLTLQQATGNIKKYYIITSITAACVLPLCWLIFKIGGGPLWAYVTLAASYLAISAEKLAILRSQVGLPVGRFLRESVLPTAAAGVLSAILPLLCYLLIPAGWWRVIAVCLTAWGSMAASAWTLAMTPGEKDFVRELLWRKAGRFFSDKSYIRHTYRKAFGHCPDLEHPQTFNEKLQWLKLNDRKPLYHTLADKYAVKDHVAGLIGQEHVIPTLGVWDSAKDIPWDSLPDKFVLKCTHDSGSTIICHDRQHFDRDAAESRLAACMKRDFYLMAREWAYKGLKPRIIAEPLLDGEVDDYKFFCFDGKPAFMFIATERNSSESETRFDFYDMDFNHLPFTNGHPCAEVQPTKPAEWDEMVRLAALLSEGMKHVRVDFYISGGKVLFGEYTFYHWGGFVPFDPAEWDNKLGEYIKL